MKKQIYKVGDIIQLQDEMWNSRDLQESFTRKMIERAVEHGGDEMFD